MISLNILLYIDPGTTALLLQLIASAFIAIGVFFKKIKLFLLNIFKKK